MLDKATQQAIGREMRRVYEHRPKGGIPDRIWRLLLALEKSVSPENGRRAPTNA